MKVARLSGISLPSTMILSLFRLSMKKIMILRHLLRPFSLAAMISAQFEVYNLVDKALLWEMMDWPNKHIRNICIKNDSCPPIFEMSNAESVKSDVYKFKLNYYISNHQIKSQQNTFAISFVPAHITRVLSKT